MRHQLWILVFILACAGALHGCATSRGELDIRVPPTANPVAGPAVKIIVVHDRRAFELKPPQASIPSLKHGEIDDPAITSRAIARKRNTFGKALGDILLPEQRSVVQLATETLAGGLSLAGYRVVREGDPDYATAAPIEADVLQFWAWVRPGAWQVGIEFEGILLVRGGLANLSQPVRARGHHMVKTATGSSKAWVQAFDLGLSDLKAQLARALSARPPALATPAAPPPALSSGGEAAPPAP